MDDQCHPIPHYTLPRLPYAYDALEPYISKEIMELHHLKHHQGYVDALNKIEVELAKPPTFDYYAGRQDPEDLQDRIVLQAAFFFNIGGHVNHSLFWKNLAPHTKDGVNGGGVLREGFLKEAIVQYFGCFDRFKKTFDSATLGIQGSGWGWLGFNLSTGGLEIVTTVNQDRLLAHFPIIGVDIWEHAYYLQYKNVKAEYLENIWNVINFEEAQMRFDEAKKLYEEGRKKSEAGSGSDV
ncbi:manganese superoxide dismutase [Pisolithus thermaeus]|nr:manganese superoxide dismutase [Pisolithus croceorrhizus]KAI6137726.1 manganese superoxide dismutase [Pisolithus thermaeus]